MLEFIAVGDNLKTHLGIKCMKNLFSVPNWRKRDPCSLFQVVLEYGLFEDDNPNGLEFLNLEKLLFDFALNRGN